MSDPKKDSEQGNGRPLRGVLPAGTTLRGYELVSILGQGAFGITYRARDLTLGRDVAIKEYLPATLAMREGRTTVVPRSDDHAEQFAWGRERFLEEARTLARLDLTPAIVRVHDFLEDNGTAYMVMALIEGDNLNRRLMREQRLTKEALERVLFPVLDGLEEVHGIGFLHRDIKPANIMIDAHGRPTLIDFGAARAAMAGRSTTMTAIFTPGYAAVEQYTSADLGPWTDIYGLSATIYHAITGKTPPSSIERMVKDTCEPLAELKPERFAPELLAGIDAGMAIPAAARPQNIAEWRRVLRTGEHHASSQELTQVSVASRRRTRRTGIRLPRPALWGAAGAAAVLLAGAGYLALPVGPPTGLAPTPAATLNLSTEQLEQVLAERRKADALAADKRRLEEEARQKAQADADAKRQADVELEQARQARQQAEQELARLKAEVEAQRQKPADRQDQAAASAQRATEEAQRKAEVEAAAMRKAEEEATERAAAEAETKREADEALVKVEAERRQAEEAARAKAEAEQVALQKASAEAQRKAAEAETVRQAEQQRVKAEAERTKAEAERQKAEAEAKAKADAETAEKALRLEQPDRQRLQVALTSLGFDTRGSDGIFGPRSREMISAWQKARSQPVTGFVNAAQQQAVLKEAAPALAKLDEAKRAEEDAKTGTLVTAPLATAAATTSPVQPPPASGGLAADITKYDGAYSGTPAGSSYVGASRAVVSIRVTKGHGSGTIAVPGCELSRFSVTISPTGDASGEGSLNCVVAAPGGTVSAGRLNIYGAAKDKHLVLSFRTATQSFGVTLRPESTPPAPSSAFAPASPDGLWGGTYACTSDGGTSQANPPFTLDLNLKIANGTSSGGGVIPSTRNNRTINIEVSVALPNVTVTRTYVIGENNSPTARFSMQGTFDGTTIRASGNTSGSARYNCALTLSRIP